MIAEAEADTTRAAYIVHLICTQTEYDSVSKSQR